SGYYDEVIRLFEYGPSPSTSRIFTPGMHVLDVCCGVDGPARPSSRMLPLSARITINSH
ncbi:hypothetical protein J132_01134, partial [Termitomyces sp. J132]